MKFRFTKYGLADDPRGAHVTMTHFDGRILLGTVTDAWRDSLGYTRLTVRHFNGEPWPLEPCALFVNVLERDVAPFADLPESPKRDKALERWARS